MNKRLLLCAMIVPGALAVSPMVSAQAKESVSLKEYQQAKASQAVSLNQAMVMAFENSPVLALRRAAVSMQQGQLDHASRWAPSKVQSKLAEYTKHMEERQADIIERRRAGGSRYVRHLRFAVPRGPWSSRTEGAAWTKKPTCFATYICNTYA